MTSNNKQDQPATKKDIDTLNEKMDLGLNEVRTEMSQEFKDVRAEMSQEFKDVRAEMSRGFAQIRKETSNELSELRDENGKRYNKLFDHLDGLAKLIKDIKEEFTIHGLRHKRHEEQLEDHEQRINSLESNVGL